MCRVVIRLYRVDYFHKINSGTGTAIRHLRVLLNEGVSYIVILNRELVGFAIYGVAKCGALLYMEFLIGIHFLKIHDYYKIFSSRRSSDKKLY